MWNIVESLIYFVARIWRADSDIRDQSPLINGSQFDRQSRRYVACLCGGAILLLLLVGLIWWLAGSR